MRKKSENSLGTRDVYRAVAERENFRKDHTRLCLDTFCTVVAEALAAGKTVRYAPLGTFRPVTRKRRGKAETYVTVRFRPAAAVLRVLNQVQKGGKENEQR